MEASQACYASHVCSYPIIDDQHSVSAIVFVKLIAKIKGWKRMRDYPPSRVSYSSVEFLLEFFSSYDSTNDIFAFLRLVAATWICTHKGRYGQHVREGQSPEDWCSMLVIPPHAPEDRIIPIALAEALQ